MLRQHHPPEGAPALLQEGTTKLLEAAKSTPENGREAAPDGAQLLHDAALLRAWQAVRFVSCAAKGHWGVNGAFLAPHLLHFVPSLLKLQVGALLPRMCGKAPDEDTILGNVWVPALHGQYLVISIFSRLCISISWWTIDVIFLQMQHFPWLYRQVMDPRLQASFGLPLTQSCHLMSNDGNAGSAPARAAAAVNGGKDCHCCAQVPSAAGASAPTCDSNAAGGRSGGFVGNSRSIPGIHPGVIALPGDGEVCS